MSAPNEDPPPLVKLSKAQIDLIRSSPIHRRIKHCVYSVLGISAFGFFLTITTVTLGCILAGPLVKVEQRWLIFHYVFVSIFASLWLVYAGIYYRDVKYAAWADQLKIDGGWISFVVIFSSSFFFYLHYKLRSLATVDSLGQKCVFTCETDLQFVRLSPLVVGIFNLFLLSIQLYLLVLLFRNPIVNPPLDEHGMPKPINPLTGEVMAMRKDGKPILPPELQPVRERVEDDEQKTKEATKKVQSGGEAPEWEPDFSDAATLSPSDSEAEEKTLLNEDGAIGHDEKRRAHALGRRKNRREDGRSKRSSRRG